MLDGLKALHPANKKRLDGIEEVNRWRNAIAHQDFGRNVLKPATLHLKSVERLRRQCTSLARDLDRVLYSHLTKLVGISPW